MLRYIYKGFWLSKFNVMAMSRPTYFAFAEKKGDGEQGQQKPKVLFGGQKKQKKPYQQQNNQPLQNQQPFRKEQRTFDRFQQTQQQQQQQQQQQTQYPEQEKRQPYQKRGGERQEDAFDTQKLKDSNQKQAQQHQQKSWKKDDPNKKKVVAFSYKDDDKDKRKIMTPSQSAGPVMGAFLKILEKESQEYPQQQAAALGKDEAEMQQHIQKRIDSFEALERQPKTITALMDLYIVANKPEKTKALYYEYEKLKFEKTEMVENLMADACIKSQVEAAQSSKAFFNDYLIKNNKLKLIYRNHINSYIELLANQRADNYDVVQDLNIFLQELKKNGIRIASLDLAVFKQLLQNAVEGIHEECLTLNIEVFINYFDYVLESKKKEPGQKIPQQQSTSTSSGTSTQSGAIVDDLFHNIVNTRKIFKQLNDLDYPRRKFDSKEGNKDLCELFLNVLHRGDLLSSLYIDFVDLAKWLGLHLNKGLDKIFHYTQIIEDPALFKALSEQIKSKQNPDNNEESSIEQLIAVDDLRQCYANLRAIALSSSSQNQQTQQQQLQQNHQQQHSNKAGLLTKNSIDLILELAYISNQHDLIFDIFENYKRLTNGKRKDLQLYNILLQTITSLDEYLQPGSSKKNCKDVVDKILKEMQNNNVEMMIKRKEMYQIQALIIDEKYEDALQLFNDKFYKEYTITFQKLKIKYFLMSLLKEQTFSGEYVVAESHISRFINTLSPKFLQQMYLDEEVINQEIRTFIGDENVNIHEFMRNQEQQDNFLRIKKLVESGKMELKITREMETNPDNFHYNEIYIIQNYERLDKEFQRQRSIRKLMERSLFKKKEFDAYTEIKTPKDLEKIKPQYDKELAELQKEIAAIRSEAAADVVSQPTTTNNDKTQVDQGKKNLATFYKLKELVDNDEKKPGQLKMKFLNKDNLEEAKILHKNLYSDIERIIKIPVQKVDSIVWELLAWGIQCKQPFAINLGEKYAETVGAQIPHYLANQIQLFFNYINEDIKNKDKIALQLIGPIKREKIYDLSKGYQHVLIDPLQTTVLLMAASSNPQLKFNAQFLLQKELTVNKYHKHGVPIEKIKERLDSVSQQTINLKQNQ